MLAYRQPADHFAPQASSSRAQPQPQQPQPRSSYTHAAPSSRYDPPPLSKHSTVAFPTFSSAPLAVAPPAPPAQPTSAQAQAAQPAKAKKATSKLTEQWGTPPDLIKRDDEWLERGKMLGEVSRSRWNAHSTQPEPAQADRPIFFECRAGSHECIWLLSQLGRRRRSRLSPRSN